MPGRAITRATLVYPGLSEVLQTEVDLDSPTDLVRPDAARVRAHCAELARLVCEARQREAPDDESVLGSTKPEGSLISGNQGPSLLHGLKQLIPITKHTWVQLWDELNGDYTVDVERQSEIL